VLLCEQHLRRVIDEYVEHCHAERPHQGLGNTVIDGVQNEVVATSSTASGWADY